MTPRRSWWLSLIVLSACGGGGEQVAVVPSSGGSGDMPAAAALGPVTAVSPFTVADVAFRLDGQGVQIPDGDDDGRGPLPGMVARAEGAMDAGNRSGRATMPASTQAELRGPIDSLAPGELRVLGQMVRVNAATVRDGFGNLSELAVGDRVQVHGLIAPDSVLQATRLQRRARNDAVVKLVGTVSYENCATCLPSGTQFRVGGLVVRAEAALLQGLTLPIPAGTAVRVRAAAGPAGEPAVLAATAIGPYLATPLLADAITRVRGIVSEPVPGQLRLQGLPLSLGSPVTYEGGSANDLRAGRAVTVEGRYRNGGVVALAVRFEP